MSVLYHTYQVILRGLGTFVPSFNIVSHFALGLYNTCSHIFHDCHSLNADELLCYCFSEVAHFHEMFLSADLPIQNM